MLLLLDDLDELRRNDGAGLARLLNALLGTRLLRLLVTGREGLPGRVAPQRRVRLGRLDPGDDLDALLAYAPPAAAWGHWAQADLDRLLRLLDGYPFPIRLAAAYLDQTGCGLRELLRRLESSPERTMRFQDDEEERETSPAATLVLSFAALPPATQTLWPTLALFPAGLNSAAAAAILGPDSIEQLETLARFSMAEQRPEGDERRWLLPEPARRYAHTLLPTGALHHHGPAALRFFHDLAEWANDLGLAGQDEQEALLLSQDLANIYQFLDWGYEHEQPGGTSLSARATWFLRNYWSVTSAFGQQEVLLRLQRALAAAQRCQDNWGEAYTRKALGDVQQFRDQYAAAEASYHEALGLFRAVGDRLGEANTRKALGDVQRFRAEYVAAEVSYHEALALFRAFGDRVGEANTLRALGNVQQRQANYDEASDNYTQALALYRQIGARLGEANTLGDQGEIALVQGDKDLAEELLDQAIAIYQTISDHYGIAVSVGNYGWALRRVGRAEEARPYLLRAAELFAAMGLDDRAERCRQAAGQGQAAQ